MTTLLSKILNRSTQVDECLIWNGCLNSDGYPRMMLKGNSNIKVHRLVHELSSGQDINGLVVRHSCDNPLCINPKHLSSGTPADNMLDRDSRDRHGASKLSHQKVREIRKMFELNPKLKSPTVAEQFGISPRTVLSIKHRNHWKNVY